MPQKLLLYSAFVACPSDCDHHRETIRDIISDVNRLASRNSHVRISYLGWDTDVVPSAGTSVQSVIDSQIGDTYDILICIFHTRLGTPTDSQPSGTASEYRSALDRFRRTGLPHIMVYHDVSPCKPELIDPAQLGALNAFIKSIKSDNVLMAQFDGREELSRSMRLHLTRVMQLHESQGASQHQELASSLASPDKPSQEQAVDNEVLDDVVLAEQRATEANEVVTRMTSTLQTFAVSMATHAIHVNSISLSGNDSPAASAKRIIDSSADDMNLFAQKTQADVDLLSVFMNESLEAFGRAVQFSLTAPEQEHRQDVSQVVDTLSELAAAISDTRTTIQNLRAQVSMVPTLTGRFKKARLGVLEALDKTDQVFDGLATNCTRMCTDIRKVLNNS